MFGDRIDDFQQVYFVVPALPTEGTVSGPGTAHRAGADPLGGFRRAELRARGVEVGGGGDRP